MNLAEILWPTHSNRAVTKTKLTLHFGSFFIALMNSITPRVYLNFHKKWICIAFNHYFARKVSLSLVEWLLSSFLFKP